jgi:hypothetical protein
MGIKGPSSKDKTIKFMCPKKMFHLKFLPISKQTPLKSGPSFLVLGRAASNQEDKTPLKEKKRKKCQTAMLNRFQVKQSKGRQKVITSHHKMKHEHKWG